MSVQLYGNVMPTDMAARGALYKFSPPKIVAVSGSGVAVTSGYSSLTWRWTWLQDTEYAYLVTTVLGGAASVTATSATSPGTDHHLYNHLKTLTTYTKGTVYRPEYESYRNGYYYNVTLIVEGIS